MEFISKYDVDINDYGQITFKDIDIKIFLRTKYRSYHIVIGNVPNLKDALILINDFVDNSNLFIEDELSIFKFDILKKENASFIKLNGVNIYNDDIYQIKSKFKNLHGFETNNCLFADKCNLGILNTTYIDDNSKMKSLDIFNGFNGEKLYLNNTSFKDENKNIVHINSAYLKLKDIYINYQLLFLTLDAPLLKELVIEKEGALTDKDLIFISGLYSLEKFDAYSILSDYNQIHRLEKLKHIYNVFCNNSTLLNNTKTKRKKTLEEIGATKGFNLDNYLMVQAMFFEQDTINFRNRITLDRIQRVKWQDKIAIKDKKIVKRDLEEAKEMLLQNKLSNSEDTYDLVSSNPLEDTFKYYRKSKIIK